MTLLYDKLRQIQDDSRAMQNLSETCRLGETEIARAGYSMAIPYVMQGLIKATGSDQAIDALLVRVRAFSWSEKDDPREVIASDYLLVGSDTVDELFPGAKMSIINEVATAAGVSAPKAKNLLESTSMLALASLAGLSDQAMTKDSFVRILDAESQTPAALVELPTMDRVDLTARRQSPVAGTSAEQAEASGNKQSRNKGLLIGAGALVGLLLIGGIGLALTGGGDDETVTSEAQIEIDDDPVDDTGGVETDARPETDATNDGTVETAEEPPGALADADPVVDDWPGGNGPVPEGPPIRRTLLLNPGGDLVLSGSAPTWELALQSVRLAEQNFPVDGVTVVNELTWHPEAARSVQSGDAVIPQAATFASGQVDLNPDSFEALDLAAAVLNNNSSVYVVVIGHTDEVGDAAQNAALSAARVGATVDYLLGQGVVPGQIVTAAAGEDDPTASNDTADGRQSNRRVELLFKNYLAPIPGGN